MPLNNPTDIQYIVTIYKRENDGSLFEAMGSVYSKYCVVTSAEKAIDIESNKTRYYVELSPTLQQITYNIELVSTTQGLHNNQFIVSTTFGLLRVSFKT